MNLQFRIVGAHLHAAVVGPDTYICARQTTVTEAGLSVSWVVVKGQVPLKQDCRTLNEAKNFCRAAALAHLHSPVGVAPACAAASLAAGSPPFAS